MLHCPERRHRIVELLEILNLKWWAVCSTPCRRRIHGSFALFEDKDKKSQMRICTLGLSGDRVSQFKTELLPVWCCSERVVSRGGLQVTFYKVVRGLPRLFWWIALELGMKKYHAYGLSFWDVHCYYVDESWQRLRIRFLEGKVIQCLKAFFVYTILRS